MDNLQDHIGKLREDFMQGSLSESESSNDPAAQFELWLKQAVDAGVPEVQAMNLSTVSPENKPSSRIVYLREFGNNEFTFYTNYKSRKAEQLEKNPHAALTFFWPELERQIRIEGVIEKVSVEQSDKYFNSRPYESKIGAWASSQSQKLGSREELDAQVNHFKLQFKPESIIRPEFWGGYKLKANYYEFWQGRKSRLHDRLSYEPVSGQSLWTKSRLSP